MSQKIKTQNKTKGETEESQNKKERQSCRNIVKAIFAKESDRSYQENTVKNYAEKLYPFLQKLYSMDGLDTNGGLDLKKLYSGSVVKTKI